MEEMEAESECPEDKKKIKVQTVCLEKRVRSVNDIIIPAPIGIDIDQETGQLKSRFHVEVISKPKLAVILEDGILIDEGLLHVKIIFENPKIIPCSEEKKSICQELFIPIQSVIPIKDNKCDDNATFQTETRLLATSIFGFPIKTNNLAGNQISLIVKVVLDITTIILKEEFITIYKKSSHKDTGSHNLYYGDQSSY